MDGRLSPPLEDVDHILGELSRPMQLVMFGDFQCPFCLGAQSVLRRVRDRLGDEMAFAFRHLPIPERHPLAQVAAEASEGAGAQGRFWDFYDAVYAAQPKLSKEEVLLEIAREIGLDAERIGREIAEETWTERVGRDLASAADSGATGTPTFFVNGMVHYGAYDASSLVEALRAPSP